MEPDSKSFVAIGRGDLRRLAAIAAEHRADFFRRHPEFGILYRDRVLCVALAEDAARHYTNGMSGFEAFSVWTFYAEHPEAPFPYQRTEREDFGRPKFGRLPEGPDSFRGRPVALHGRSLIASPIDDPVETLQDYLRKGETPTPRGLARGAVVLIAPERLLGYVVWPTLVPSR
jgi:hypothetical protein